MAVHVVIPDTQIKPGVPTDHLRWIGQYIVDKFAGHPNFKIIHLGDHWDFPSLSSYDRGKMAMEGRRIHADLEAGNDAMKVLDKPLNDYNEKRIKNKKKPWYPKKYLLRGNHEYRAIRTVEENPALEGFLTDDLMLSPGWEVSEFLKVVDVDDVSYSHFFANPMTGRPYGGSVATRLKNIGHSFTMGHQQTYDHAVRYVRGKPQIGLVAGACLTPDHRVLTADLRYVPLGSVRAGDTLVSFDEEISDSPGRARRYKTGTVNAVKLDEEEVFAVTLSNGKVFKATADHLWLSKLGTEYVWRRTDRMRKGTRVAKPLAEWDTATSHEAGYLAGMFDGEGCYSTRVTSSGAAVGALSLSQKPGTVLDRTIDALASVCSETTTGTTNQKGVTAIRIGGGLRGVAHVLGMIRPMRLLNKFKPEHLGRLTTTNSKNPTVVSIVPIGRQEIVRVDVDAKTMIVEGYAHHNCYLHDEDYKGFQGNDHFRGIIVKHQVEDGAYDIMQVSIDYLCRRYEGKPVAVWLREQGYGHYSLAKDH